MSRGEKTNEMENGRQRFMKIILIIKHGFKKKILQRVYILLNCKIGKCLWVGLFFRKSNLNKLLYMSVSLM